MILATYQPANPNPSKTEKMPLHKALCNRMGYTPIWCFAANTLQELFRNSILAAPNWPEVFYIFTTEEYTPIDVVQWNKIIFEHSGEFNIDDSILDSCFEIKDEKYCEYLIEQIPEDQVMFELNIHDVLFHTNFSVDFGGSISNELSGMVNDLREYAANFVMNGSKNITVSGNCDHSVLKKQANLRLEKTAFELYLAPILVGTQLPDQSLLDWFSLHPNTYFDKLPRLSLLLAQNYNGDVMPTYERQDDLLAMIDSCIKPRAPWGHKKIGRNEPCPCGSGKKYKKCCLGKYAD